VASTYASEDLLPSMARIVAEATGAARTDVWLRSGGEFRDGAWWPADAEPRPVILLPDGSLPAESGPERIVPVIYDGELLGGLSITKQRGDAVTPAEDKLVGNLAAQAGLVLRNVGLTEQLMARLAELRASRERLVTTQDRERRRLERDIRDGAQRQLAGLASKLGLAAQALEHDEDHAKALLDEVISHSAEALKDLRELARGIYPALLADMGIAAALDAQARKAPIPVSVEAGGIGRYPQETEAAVYFCSLEALRNAAEHADPSRAIVRLSESNAELAFEVADDGRGFDPSTTHQGTGLQGMADRIDALGGHVQVDSGPGQGTRISGRVPASAIS
jgi:signal transduction histidine kinase